MTPLRTAILGLALTGFLVGPAFSQTTAPARDGAPAEGASTVGDDATSAVEAGGEADASATMLQALSPLVADVQIVGPWQEGERTGIWRTITLQPSGEGAGNRFFVQQIAERDGAPAVTVSIEITEVADLEGALIGYRADPPTEAQPELLSMFLDIVPLDGELAETYELFLTASEPYVFGPASN